MLCEKYKILRFRYNDTVLYNLSMQIRKQVFVDEQNVPPEIECDEFEQESFYYLVLCDDKPIATCRYRITEKGIKLERFAVLPVWRKNKIGHLLMNAFMDDVIEINKSVYFHSQEEAVGFYQKFGFRVIGERFYEANIPHFTMILVSNYQLHNNQF